jgi:hypothetical protein
MDIFRLCGRVMWGPILAVALVAGGCASAPPPLQPGQMAGLGGVRVLSSVPTGRIAVNVKEQPIFAQSLAALGTIIDMTTAAVRQRAANKRVVRLQEAAAGVPFREPYWEALEATLATVPGLETSPVERNPAAYSKDELAGVSPPFLLLTTTYELTGHDHVLLVRTGAALYVDSREKPARRGEYTYVAAVPGPADLEGEDAVAAWAANDAAAYRAAVREGIAETMVMLRTGLAGEPTARNATDEAESVQFTLGQGNWLAEHVSSGKAIGRTPGRVLLETEPAHLMSIPSSLQF